MANIVITRPLTQSGCNLISVYMESSIDFTANVAGLADGWYVKILFDNIYFTPYLESTVGDANYFTFDFGDLLKSKLGNHDYNTSLSAIEYDIILYNVGEEVVDVKGELIDLTHAYTNIAGKDSQMIDLFEGGRTGRIVTSYSNKISFYWGGTSGNQNIILNGGSPVSTSLTHGFNELTTFTLIEGLNTLAVGSAFTLSIYYRPLGSCDEILTWVGSDGTKESYKFTNTTKEISSKRTKEINNYAKQSSLLKSKTTMIANDSSIKLSFTTIAVDAEHFDKLTEMQDSFVEYNGKRYEVTNISSVQNPLKPNLRFNITIEADRYVASH